MPYNNPVVSGSVLVRTAIQSIDYQAGVSGWAIFRDGTSEFNNVTVRGTFLAGGGAVRLNAGGLHIAGSGVQFDINIVAGFLARNDPDDGTNSVMQPNLISTTGTLTVGGLTQIGGDLFDTRTGLKYPPTQCFQAIVGVLAGTTLQALGSTNYPIAYPLGANVMGVANLRDTAANARHWRAQFIPVSRTQFQLLLTNDLAAGAPDSRNLTFDLMVFEF